MLIPGALHFKRLQFQDLAFASAVGCVPLNYNHNRNHSRVASTMAEAVGFAASVITLGEISIKVLQYLHTVKEGGRARDKLNTELMSVCLLLQQLKVQIGEDVDISEPKPAWQQALVVLDKPGGLFERLRNELNDLERKLTSSNSRFGKAMTTLRWPLTEKYMLLQPSPRTSLIRTLDRFQP